ncbi:hypothetical protein J7I84_07705 [Arthrobacter sp. ISL-85]|nr:hypothetical protein [Arthrobacter sp. ISL-85]
MDGGYKVFPRFLVLLAVSLSLVLAGTSSFVLTLGEVLQGGGLAAVDGHWLNGLSITGRVQARLPWPGSL